MSSEKSEEQDFTRDVWIKSKAEDFEEDLLIRWRISADVREGKKLSGEPV